MSAANPQVLRFILSGTTLVSVANPLIANGSYLANATWQGGNAHFLLEGTFDSASVTLEVQEPDGTANWHSVGTSTAALTAAATVPLALPAGNYRVTIASVVTACDLRCYLLNSGGHD